LQLREFEEPKKSSLAGPLAYLAIVVIVVLIAFYSLPVLSNLVNLGALGSKLGQIEQGTTSVTTLNFGNSNVSISYPSDYNTLANYALGIINQNRSANGAPPVILSPIQSGQQHADSMLQGNYFSHWDTQGYKPYMRYTLLNGTGFVDENVAYEVNTLAFNTLKGREDAINNLQWAMVYNDSICCNNGHERNILNATHNRVSIGIAYDSSHMYFVEDFENYYINLNTSVFSPSTATVSIEGATTGALNPSDVQIYYDPTPTALSSQQLNSQYQKPYDPGSFAGGVFPTCNPSFQNCPSFGQQFVNVYASTWSVTSNSVKIVFSLANFVSQDGNGTYTIYLTQGNGANEIFYTSISIFVQT
jgi:uncharacterized protein YkwD